MELTRLNSYKAMPDLVAHTLLPSRKKRSTQDRKNRVNQICALARDRKIHKE